MGELLQTTQETIMFIGIGGEEFFIQNSTSTQA